MWQSASASLGCTPVIVISSATPDTINASDIQILDDLSDDVRSAAAAAVGVDSSGHGTADEAYSLNAGPAGCVLRAGGPRGALWGLRTLAQLTFPQHAGRGSSSNRAEFAASAEEGGSNPRASESTDAEVLSVEVEDWPEWGWRGCMLDCARHWMPVDYVMRMIEALSHFKMNVLHWHLSDDQV